jgi:hypothetical protein
MRSLEMCKVSLHSGAMRIGNACLADSGNYQRGQGQVSRRRKLSAPGTRSLCSPDLPVEGEMSRGEQRHYVGDVPDSKYSHLVKASSEKKEPFIKVAEDFHVLERVCAEVDQTLPEELLVRRNRLVLRTDTRPVMVRGKSSFHLLPEFL